MQAKRFFFEKKKQKTFIHCRRHGVRTENSVPSETDKSFLVLFCKKERLALLRFQWVDLPGQKPFLQKRTACLLRRVVEEDAVGGAFGVVVLAGAQGPEEQ